MSIIFKRISWLLMSLGSVLSLPVVAAQFEEQGDWTTVRQTAAGTNRIVITLHSIEVGPTKEIDGPLKGMKSSIVFQCDAEDSFAFFTFNHLDALKDTVRREKAETWKTEILTDSGSEKILLVKMYEDTNLYTRDTDILAHKLGEDSSHFTILLRFENIGTKYITYKTSEFDEAYSSFKHYCSSI